MKPVAITMGDSSGVGPEIILHAFEKRELPDLFVVVGDRSALNYAKRVLNLNTAINPISDVAAAKRGELNLLDLALLQEDELRPGEISKAAGQAALEYVKVATELAIAGRVS